MSDFFSPDYYSARARFRSGVLANGGQIESILLDAKGPAPEISDLTVDIGYFGAPEPRRAFIHSSGLRGVDGFAGSAIQLQWLEEGPAALPPDAAIVMVHAMNPFGMAWLRCANRNNVDLSHNFLTSDEEYAGASGGYRALNPFLNPPSPPAWDFFPLRALLHAVRHGLPALRRAIVEGQYEFPQGIRFGGRQHEQEARRFQLYISGKLACAERIVAIDVRTGPRPGRIATNRAKGSLEGLYSRMFSGAQLSFSVQDLTSCHWMTALAALRNENRQHHYGDASAQTRAKANLLEVFCPPSPKWREQVLALGEEAITEALAQAFA